MNEPTRPLSPDIVDELLSADIDGEFDRAATELGFTPETARSALDAAPGAPLRRAALLRARDLMATRPELAEADELRLVGSALEQDTPGVRVAREGPPARDKRRFTNTWRVLVAAGSAAAVIAAIVAISADRPGEQSKADSAPTRNAAGSSSAAKAAGNSAGALEFGDVSAPATLRAKVRARLHTLAAPAPAPTTTKSADYGSPLPESSSGPTGAAGGTGPLAADAVQAPQGLQGGTGPDRQLFARGDTSARHQEAVRPQSTPPTCLAAAGRAAHASAATLSGTGTYAGRPVVVAVYHQGSGYTVLVLSTPGCSIISRVTLP